jgi:endonuclease/exonuclease/phosphatase family metal-dependent hydrolase
VSICVDLRPGLPTFHLRFICVLSVSICGLSYPCPSVAYSLTTSSTSAAIKATRIASGVYRYPERVDPRASALVVALSATVAINAAPDVCVARERTIGSASLHWIPAPDEDLDEVEQWCRGVGPPLYVPTPSQVADLPPAIEDLVILTWNAHLSEGRLADVVQALRSGQLTEGQPVDHFVLLVQELFRRDPDIPSFGEGIRGAHAIRARDESAPDVNDYARALGLSMLYVPSMRNGAKFFEDRGNAIVSTEPLSGALAVELPFARQRRVAVGASIDVVHDGRRSTVRVLNTHLEPLSSPKSLWFLRDPRRRQMTALLSLITASRFEDDVAWVATVFGGDFNTVQNGAEEPTYRAARRWSSGFVQEDRRVTHLLGRIDYLFFRVTPGLAASTTRVPDKFGSDHHPVLGRFSSTATVAQ